MRFKCKEETPLYEWHPYFALLPRKVESGECVWLERIERKGFDLSLEGLAFDYTLFSPWVWTYRLPPA